MQWGSLIAIASIALSANALLRFPCSQLVIERLDPWVFRLRGWCALPDNFDSLVTPGSISPHLHQIIGGVSSSRTTTTGVDANVSSIHLRTRK